MPKQINILMETDYPFGQCDEQEAKNTKVLVRQILELDSFSESKSSLMRKAQLSRKIGQSLTIIKINSVLEQDQALHILYEYVPAKLEKWLPSLERGFLQDFCKSFKELASDLSSAGVVTDLSVQKMGMDESSNPKYFLGLDFQVEKSADKSEIYSTYVQQIEEIFFPYLGRVSNEIKTEKFLGGNHKTEFEALGDTRNLRGNQLSDTKQLSKIIEQINSKESESSGGNLPVQLIDKPIEHIRQLDRDEKTQDIIPVKSTNIVRQKVAPGKLRKYESINVNSLEQRSLEPYYPKDRKESSLSSVSHVKLGHLISRINDLKHNISKLSFPKQPSTAIKRLNQSNPNALTSHPQNKTPKLNSSSSTLLKQLQQKQQERKKRQYAAIQPTHNALNMSGKKSPIKSEDTHSQYRYTNNYADQPSPGYSLFDSFFRGKNGDRPSISVENALKLSDSIAKEIFRDKHSLKKNEKLKQQQYNEMINSESQYFQEFANVLNDQQPSSSSRQLITPEEITHEKDRQTGLLREESHFRREQQQSEASKFADPFQTNLEPKTQQEKYDQNKELKDRVRRAILNSKSLISQFGVKKSIKK